MVTLTTRSVTATLLAVAVVGAAAVGAGAVGVASAASNASLSAAPATAGETSTHAVTLTAGNASAGAWNGLTVDYSESDTDVGDVDASDVTTIGIDRDADNLNTTVDVNVSDDLGGVQTSNDGETLTVTLGGSYDLSAGDEVVVVVEGVDNPSEAGEYTVPLNLNPQTSGGNAQAILVVERAQNQTTPADTTTDTATTTPAETTTESGTTTDSTTTEEQVVGTPATTTDDGSGGSIPGFGVGVAVLAVVAAALVAVRE